MLLDGNSGDENYSEKFPYAVYQIGSGENVSFDVSGASAAYDGVQIAAGEDFALTAESGGTTIAVDEIAYSYSSDGATFTDGLPSNAGTYIVKASVSGIIDAENHIFYEGAEYTFAYQIAPAEPNVVGVAVSIDENDTVSVESFSVVGIMEGSDVSVVVKSCAMLEDGRVRIVYALIGSDAANYLVPGDTYTTIQRSGLEEVNAAIGSLNAAMEALESSASSSDEALQAAIDEVQTKLDEAVQKLEGAFAEGDEANAAALAEAVKELKTAFEAADGLLASDIAELESSGEALQAALDALDEAYRAADEAVLKTIGELQTENDGLREELGGQEKELNTLNVVVWVALAVAVLAVGVGAAGLVFGIKAGKRDNSAS